jgi:hypothetical protein
MTDFRALCAELLEALENAIRVIYHEDGTKHISTADPVIAKADAALAQPESQGPGPDDVTQLYYKHGGGDGMYGGMGEVNFEEAVEEALARWGRSATNVREQI